MNRLTLGFVLGLMAAWSGDLLAQDKAVAAEEGFVSLFDGKSLAGWTGSLAGYAVEDGHLVCVAGGKGNLLTEAEYSDFAFKFEFVFNFVFAFVINVYFPLCSYLFNFRIFRF